MATLRILESRRTGAYTSDFVVEVVDGRMVVSTEPHPSGVLLHCFNWILEDGQFVGQTISTVQKPAREVTRYERQMQKLGIPQSGTGKSG